MIPRPDDDIPTLDNLKSEGYIKEEEGTAKLDLEKGLDLVYTQLTNHSKLLQQFDRNQATRKDTPEGKLTLAKKLARVEELRDSVRQQQLALANNYVVICR